MNINFNVGTPIYLTRTKTSASSSWGAFMNAFTPTSYGIIMAYMAGSINTPSAFIGEELISGDATSDSHQIRANGNGARDFALTGFLFKGKTYVGRCIYSFPVSIIFWPISIG